MNYKNMALGGLAVSAISLALVACSGSGKAPATQTGQLIDAAVEGVSYTTSPGGLTGTTDDNGNYNYLPGDKVTFSIGNIVFPEVDAKGTVTPLDLAGATQVQNGTVVNISRLLQSLDSDNNPDNGITIPPGTTGSAYDFTQDASSFEAAFKADFPNLNLISQADAVAHLIEQLNALNSSGGGALGPNETAATIPASFAKSYDLTFSESATGSGIADGAITNFVVGADGSLTIDGSNKLTNPVYFKGNEREAIWKDTANNLVYAMSDLKGLFNEINVFNMIDFSASSFVFYGQYKDATAGSGPFVCPSSNPGGSLTLTGDSAATDITKGSHCPSLGQYSTVAQTSINFTDGGGPDFVTHPSSSLQVFNAAGVTTTASGYVFIKYVKEGPTWELEGNPGTLASLGVTVDSVQKMVTFTNATLPPKSGGAVGNLILNGTINYEDVM